MKSIKVGGVPEHFNLPWHLCIEEGLFRDAGVNVIWKDFPDGTGAMNKALRNGEIDAAVILTEGIIKDISAGNSSRIIQTYVASPLVWGIHVAAGSNYKNLADLEGTTAAISREGSGSHLMAYVNAQNNDWQIDTLKFKIVGTLENAVESLKNDEAQYFMWEHFTTKPLVDAHIFRRIADCPTPWPCFVIAARDEAIKYNSPRLKTMLEVLNKKTKEFKDLPEIDKKLADNYAQNLNDIKTWLEMTHWSQQQLSLEALKNVQDKLLQLKLIPEKLKTEDIIHNL
ncbi:substrate-binding domain-containing protein [Salegentibacter sp. HM20]